MSPNCRYPPLWEFYTSYRRMRLRNVVPNRKFSKRLELTDHTSNVLNSPAESFVPPCGKPWDKTLGLLHRHETEKTLQK